MSPSLIIKGIPHSWSRCVLLSQNVALSLSLSHLNVSTQLSDRSDPFMYAIRNAPLISLAGVISGFQEAYYKFEVRIMFEINGTAVEPGSIACVSDADRSTMHAENAPGGQ